MNAPTTRISAEEFERHYAERSGMTVEQLRAVGRSFVRPCHCGSELCEGWQSVSYASQDELADRR